MKKRKFRKDWYLGFFGFFAVQGIPGLIEGDWMRAFWLVWIVWFLYWVPVKK